MSYTTDDICTICMGKMYPKSSPLRSINVTVPCRHTFHYKCLKVWEEHLGGRSSCPTCRHKSGFISQIVNGRMTYVEEAPETPGPFEVLSDDDSYSDEPYMVFCTNCAATYDGNAQCCEEPAHRRI